MNDETRDWDSFSRTVNTYIEDVLIPEMIENLNRPLFWTFNQPWLRDDKNPMPKLDWWKWLDYPRILKWKMKNGKLWIKSRIRAVWKSIKHGEDWKYYEDDELDTW
jgi:hypothetical protein